MKHSSKDLKQIARELLQGKYGTFIGTNVILSLIISAVIFIPALLYRDSSLSSYIIRQVITYIISLVTTVLSVGMLQLSLNASRNKTYGVADLFYGFRHHPDRIIVASFICMLINLIYTVPYLALLWFSSSYLYFTSNIPMILGISLATLCGWVISYIILLRFQLVYYLLLDNNEMGAIEALRTSARLMKGSKGRYFYLELSFIGITLLGFLSFGIGLLWVYPYMTMTITQFYREAIGELDVRAYDDSSDQTSYQYSSSSYPKDFY